MNASLAGDRMRMAMIGLAVVAFMSVIAAGGAWQSALAAKEAAQSSEDAAESAGRVAQTALEEILQNQVNANASRSALCQTILYDGDRLEINAPVQDAPCRWPEVIALYPPEVCAAAPSLGAPNLCVPLD